MTYIDCIYSYIYTCTQTNTQTDTHIHKHTHTHTQAHAYHYHYGNLSTAYIVFMYTSYSDMYLITSLSQFTKNSLYPQTYGCCKVCNAFAYISYHIFIASHYQQEVKHLFECFVCFCFISAFHLSQHT